MKQHNFNRSNLSKIMTFDDFQEVNRVYLEWANDRYQNLPYIIELNKVINSKSFSGMITNYIIKYLIWSGFQAERINTTGIIRNGSWTYSGGTRGSADISAIIKGKSVKIEVKYGKDTQSEAQKKYQESVERAGGVYWIVKSFTEFLIKYKAL